MDAADDASLARRQSLKGARPQRSRPLAACVFDTSVTVLWGKGALSAVTVLSR